VVNLYRVGVTTHRVSMKSFNALPERGASPLPGLNLAPQNENCFVIRRYI